MILSLLVLCARAYAQTSESKPPVDYAASPVWITMMNDTNANYFEVVKAYDAFWKDRVKPESEEEMQDAAKSGHADKDNDPHGAPLNQYAFECKKYEHWLQEVQPYIQPNGHILTPHEQLLLWQQHAH